MNNCCNLGSYIKSLIKNDYKYFIDKKNVIGIGRGFKVKNSFRTTKQCIIVFVSAKVSSNSLSKVDLIPSIYRGIHTDVIQSDIPNSCSLTNKIRPVTGGYAVGVKEFPPGSIGCLVADSSYDYILTSAHNVIGTRPRGLNGVTVLQPPPQYGGKSPRDDIGSVSDSLPPSTRYTNNMDAATIVTNRDLASPDITYLGLIRGTNKAKLGEKVKKVGSISGLTTGNVTAIDSILHVNILGKDFRFEDQIITTKMSVEGDSGSLLVNKNMEAIGLLMANSGSTTVYNDINVVLERFNVYIVRR